MGSPSRTAAADYCEISVLGWLAFMLLLLRHMNNRAIQSLCTLALIMISGCIEYHEPAEMPDAMEEVTASERCEELALERWGGTGAEWSTRVVSADGPCGTGHCTDCIWLEDGRGCDIDLVRGLLECTDPRFIPAHLDAGT
jgi:hypothetical protein